MDIALLKESIELIPDHDLSQNMPIKEKILATYIAKIKQELTAIITQHDDTAVYHELEHFLAKNWLLIKGSYLSYTSTPESVASKLLCKTAEAVCEYKNRTLDTNEFPKTPIEFLMPGLSLESRNSSYPHLSVTQKTSLTDEKKIELARLSRLRQQGLFEPDNLLSEEETVWYSTALRLVTLKNKAEAENATELDIEKFDNITDDDREILSVFTEQTQRDLERKKKNTDDLGRLKYLQEIQELINTENAQYEVVDDWLFPKKPLEKIISSHILSEDGKSLVPVSLLLDSNKERPYDDTFEKILDSETKRLIFSSPETQAFFNAQEELERLKGDKSHLLGHLTQLCKQLKLNDAYEGRGRDDNAGAGAYPAIIDFNGYYQTLSYEDKSKIPQPLKVEIDKLLNLSSDKSQNINATITIETCIALRRGALEKAIIGNEALLSRIACSDRTKEQLISEAEKKLEKTQRVLEMSLHNNSYKGQDVLPISRKIIDAFTVDVKINSLADLTNFMELEPNEIRGIVNNNHASEELALILKTLEELVIFIHETPTEKINAFFDVTSPHLLSNLYKSDKDGKAILLSLEDEKLVMIYNKLQAHRKTALLVDFVKEPEKLILLINSIPEKQRLEAVKEKDIYGKSVLQQAERNPELLKKVLNCLPINQRLEVVKEKNGDGSSFLHKAISSPELLKNILETLPENQRLEAIKEKDSVGLTVIYRATSNPMSLKAILEVLPQKQRFEVIEEKDDSFGHSILHQAGFKLGSLQTILKLYPKDQRLGAINAIYKSIGNVPYKGQFNVYSLKSFLDLFPEEQRLDVINKSNLSGHTMATYGELAPDLLIMLLEIYPQDQRLNVIYQKDVFGPRIFNVALSDRKIFKKIFELLPPYHRLDLVSSKGRYRSSILSWAERYPGFLKIILELLTEEDRFSATIKGINHDGENILYRALKDPKKFKMIFELLAAEDRLDAVNYMDINSNCIIHQATKSPESFEVIFELLPQDQRLKAIKKEDVKGSSTFHVIAENPELLKVILELLPQEERLDAVNVKDRHGNTALCRVVASCPESLKTIVEVYPKDQRLKAVSEKDIDGYTIIGLASFNHKSFRTILALLPSDQILDAVKEKAMEGFSIIDFIYTDNIEILKIIFEFLPDEQKIEIFKEKDLSEGDTCLHRLIHNREAFKNALELLPVEQRTAALEIENSENLTVKNVIADKFPDLLDEITALLPDKRSADASKQKQQSFREQMEAVRDLHDKEQDETQFRLGRS